RGAEPAPVPVVRRALRDESRARPAQGPLLPGRSEAGTRDAGVAAMTPLNRRATRRSLAWAKTLTSPVLHWEGDVLIHTACGQPVDECPTSYLNFVDEPEATMLAAYLATRRSR